ncbi:hypothetical protein ACFSZS_03510 [Seohaeicola zhoushanensis]
MTFVTADEVARMTGFESGEAFLRARDRLEKRERFPAPMPTCLRPQVAARRDRRLGRRAWHLRDTGRVGAERGAV